MNRSFVKAEKKRRFMPGMALIVLCICGLFAGTVSASQLEDPRNGKGQINVTLKAGDEPVSGGSLIMYKVADVKSDNGFWFAYTSEFKGFASGLTAKYSSSYKAEYVSDTVFPDAFTSENTAAASLAKNKEKNYDMAADLEAYVESRSIKGTAQTLSAAGSTSFADVAPGLYLFLFLQDLTDKAAANYRMTPFLVTMPGKDQAGNYVWTVNASPKTEVDLPGTSGDKPEVSAEPSIRKRVVTTSSGTTKELTTKDLPSGTYFDFSFEAGSSSYPMPAASSGSSKSGTVMQVRINGTGTVKIGKITFKKAGKYYYTIEELEPANKNFSRDRQKYTLVYNVTESADGKSLNVSGEVHDGDANGEVIRKEINAVLSFTNPYTPPQNGITETPNPGGGTTNRTTGSTGKLPQTGQLWWPIWILLAAGAVLIITGALFRRSGRSDR